MIRNLVELIANEEDCAYDQECKYGYRVENHAVYCHNEKSKVRKCRFGCFTGGEIPDNKCEFFEQKN